ncbi:DUF2189 domain-containing protein [Maritimibacter dapengensis]|uniref:DUF2189 domain-containing protein n=1 Tax=Maritimibacter dapengensis TaxID=2836868 RepID=A0ABS6T2H2_9RHOB|nr:DUF2189 domain-containing protein [Maritimibacter dapengensis]MBV7379432.1 DUF2189 domain-containing protein [Maritimibacter dapengensis]
MTDISEMGPSPTPEVAKLDMSVIGDVLAAGWHDFRRVPLVGLFFSAFYVVGGLILYFQLRHADQSYSIIPVALGFPLLAPFLAVGLYEVSRRLELRDSDLHSGMDCRWSEILGVVFRQKDRQMPSMAVVIIMIFLFWVFIAHMVFALFLGLMPMTNILSDWQHTIFSFNGIKMLAVGSLVGLGFAYVLFSLTVVSLPLLLDKELDFITAMIVSWQFVAENRAVMIVWGIVISVLLFAAMIPAFLGLFLVMPILGHATWHLYRRALVHPA